MAVYIIPQTHIQGFKTISKLKNDETQRFSERIKNLSIGSEPSILLENWDQSNISISEKDARDVIQSIISLSRIFDNADRDIEAFSNDFQLSFKEADKSASENVLNQFKANLKVFLLNFEPLFIGRKAHEILLENKCNFHSARVVSDIRPIFEKNIENKSFYAVIVHNLKLQYQENEQSKEIYISLDLSDLKKMKGIIDRAIQKDSSIKSIQNNFKIIDIT